MSLSQGLRVVVILRLNAAKFRGERQNVDRGLEAELLEDGGEVLVLRGDELMGSEASVLQHVIELHGLVSLGSLAVQKSEKDQVSHGELVLRHAQRLVLERSAAQDLAQS